MKLRSAFLVLLVFGLSFQFSASAQGFIDVTAEHGFNYGYSSGEYGGGVSFVDFNQDGLDDITMATGNNQLLRFHQNTGLGFVELDPLIDNQTEVKQVTWVDYDNDGDLDLYITTHELNRLYKNTGDLTLVDITETCGFSDPISQSMNACWFDYDEDGLLDLIVSHRHLHLVGDITLYRNLGGDQFENTTIAAGLGGVGNSVLAMATFDFNQDGLEDLYVAQDYDAGNILFKNNGDGTFTNIAASSGTDVENDSMSATIGDYDGDGLLDIYVTNTSPGNSLYRNNGDETFDETASAMNVVLYSFTWGAVFLDADCDVDLDLYVNGISGSPSVFMFENPGDGSAYINSTFAWGMGSDNNYSVGNAIGDFDGDGRPDIAKNGSNGEQGSLWQNDFDTNNYLVLDLEGVVSNVDAIGAVLTVWIDDQPLIRRIGCGEGFSSQNSLSQFFGLGNADMVDEIVVDWPSGITTTLTDVAANQRMTIIELQCNDPEACNYDPEATDELGCTYPGCTDPEACNYNVEAGCDDGSCLNMCPGCTDDTACNFDPQANEDDGSCTYPGCIDQNAANFDPLAGCDDGSCLYYASDCEGDLNYDSQVNVADLLIMLTVLGTACD